MAGQSKMGGGLSIPMRVEGGRISLWMHYARTRQGSTGRKVQCMLNLRSIWLLRERAWSSQEAWVLGVKLPERATLSIANSGEEERARCGRVGRRKQHGAADMNVVPQPGSTAARNEVRWEP